ncbi:MAG: hypothetical protein JWO58_95 [Chitinophagaceae bacterium]|nr:hypothetical protein [Chitinophagaceae bacterium]
MNYRFLFLFCLVSTVARTQNTDSLTFEKIKDNEAVSSFDLLAVPVTEAINAKVSVASKAEEKNTEAPNSITVYNSRDINRLGYYSLEDLASITSGYSTTYQYGEAGFETRGQAAGGFNNNKHLLLIDGIPVNFTRSYKAQIQEELPLLFAQRVEFLKGPASALYGVSAFSGVVNVVPKTIESTSDHFENKISMGNRDNNKRWMSNAMLRNKWVDIQLSTGYYEKDASGTYLSNPHREDYRYWDRNQSIFAYWSVTVRKGILKGLKQGIIYMYRKGGWGEMFLGPYSSQVDRLEWNNLTPYLQYKRSLSRRLELFSYLKFNNSSEEGAYIPDNSQNTLPNPSGLSVYKSNVIDAEFLGELRYKISERSSVITGINYDWRQEQGSPHSYAYNIKATGALTNAYVYPLSTDFTSPSVGFNTVSGYLQYKTEINFLKGLIITTGLRQDMGINKLYTYSHLSPRVALVQRINNHLNLKLMTGRALRAPGIKETGQNSQYINEIGQNGFVDRGFFSLKAESIQTYEAALVQTYKNVYLSLAVFHNETTDEIISADFYYTKDTSTIKGSWFTNRPGVIKAQGFEFDLKTQIGKQWIIFYNSAFSQSKDQAGSQLPSIPGFKNNVGMTFTYSPQHPYSITLVGKYMSDFSDKSDGTPYAPIFIGDINMLFPLVSNLSAEFQVRNVSNTTLPLPSSGVPGPGRSFLITMAMKF